MPYLDEAGLAHYDPKLKEWISAQPVKTIPSSLYPWTLTEKAGAVTCWPVGGTPLKPTVDFTFTETGPASGDKGPDNPSTISGVSEVNVTHGAGNVIEFDVMTVGTSMSSIAVGNADGSFTINGTVPSVGGFLYRKNGTYAQNMELNLESYSTFLPAGTYKIGLLIESGTYTPNSGNCYIRYRTTKELGSGEYIDLDRSSSASETPTSGGTITMPDGGGWYTYVIGCGATASFSNCTIRPYLYVDGADISGDVVQANSYHTIPLGSTYYGGTLDVASGVMTVTYASVALNENTYLSGQILEELSDVYIVGFYPNPARFRPMASESQAGCSVLPIQIGTGAKNLQCIYLADNALAVRIQIAKTELGLGDGASISTVQTAVHSWLGSHPGILVYPVATPYTVQLTPTEILSLPQTDKYTPRLNTIYTDAQAVQVGYVKSPIREEYELQQAIVAQGGNI